MVFFLLFLVRSLTDPLSYPASHTSLRIEYHLLLPSFLHSQEQCQVHKPEHHDYINVC
jgi:hypothetical protein